MAGHSGGGGVTDRESILSALSKFPLATEPPVRRKAASNSASIETMWSLFVDRLSALGGSVIDWSDWPQLSGRPMWVDTAAIPFLRGHAYENCQDIWSADAGVSVAELAIAESGSIVITASEKSCRLTSLTPRLAIFLLPKTSIVETLEQAIPLVPRSTSAIVTGPSRTADIEGTLVRGVHSPGEIWVLPIED